MGWARVAAFGVLGEPAPLDPLFLPLPMLFARLLAGLLFLLLFGAFLPAIFADPLTLTWREGGLCPEGRNIARSSRGPC